MARLDGTRVAIVVPPEFEDVELLYPIICLSEEGAQVVVGVLPQETPAHFHPRPYFRDKPITGRFRSTVSALVLEEGVHYTWRPVTELTLNDFDAIMFPGGFSPDY